MDNLTKEDASAYLNALTAAQARLEQDMENGNESVEEALCNIVDLKTALEDVAFPVPKESNDDTAVDALIQLVDICVEEELVKRGPQ